MRFAELIQPLSEDEFFGRCWESEPVLIERNGSNSFASLFGLDDLDRLLGRLPPQTRIKCVGGKADQFGAPWIEGGTHNLQLAYERFHQGSTLIVDGLHGFWEPVAELCRDLFADTGMRVQANLYVTPRGGRGFASHWDGHDVLIVQLEGSKVWALYPPLPELPRPGSDGGELGGTNAPLQELAVHAGDLLYIPRGTPHDAHGGDEASLHITLGFMAATWEDALMAGVERLADANPELRRSLPRGWWSGDNLRQVQADRWREAVEELGTEQSLSDSIDALAGHLVRAAPIVADGHFGEVDRLEEITLTTVMTRRVENLARIVRSADEVTIAFPGGSVTGPSKSAWAFDFIANTAEFRVGAIPGWYNDSERLVLVKLLTRAGFIRVADRRHPRIDGAQLLEGTV